MNKVETEATFVFIICQTGTRATNPESIGLLSTEANQSAGGVRGQPAVNV